MNHLQKKKLAFMSIVNQVKGFVRTIMGALPLTLEGCVDEKSIIDYKIYGQSVQDGEPMPDNPVEVESVGEKTVNLFDIDSVSGMASFSSQLNSYYSISDGVLLSKFGAYGASTFLQCNITSLQAGQYVLRFETFYDDNGTTSVYYGIGFPDKTRIYNWTKGISSEWTSISYEFELTEDRDIFGISLQGSGTAENFKNVKCYFRNIMLCKKSDDTGVYEPYGKYKIPVTVSGRNLFNEDDDFANKVVAYNGYAHYPIQLKPNTTYSISISENNKDRYIIITNGETWTGSTGAGVWLSHLTIEYYCLQPNSYRKLTTTENGLIYVAISSASNVKYKDMLKSCIGNLQIEEGSVATDYEPYHEPVTTNIYLDKPLYKVDDYADYIDFENKKIIRKVGVMEFDESQKYPVYTLPSQNFYGFYKSISNMKKGNRQAGLCTYLYNQKKTASRIWFGVGTNSIVYFSLPDIYNSATTDSDRMQAIKDWLAGLETPFIVYYILAEETEQAIELPNIPTFKGTSIVSADTTIQPSNIEIEYYSNAKE